MDIGVAGINLENQIIETSGLYLCNDQCDRIKATRTATNKKDVTLLELDSS